MELYQNPQHYENIKAKKLKYEEVKYENNRSFDDLDLLPKKRSYISVSPVKSCKKIFLSNEYEMAQNVSKPFNIVDRFLRRESMTVSNKSISSNSNKSNVSYFFENVGNDFDEFEKSLSVRDFEFEDKSSNSSEEEFM